MIGIDGILTCKYNICRYVLFCYDMYDVQFQTCSESVTSVQGGIVGAAGYDEIVCSTYAGKHTGLIRIIVF